MRALLAGPLGGGTLHPMPDEEPAKSRPTAWIVATAVLAVVAVALGIWAFTAQSDADDAQAKLDVQAQAAQESADTPEPAEVDADMQQRYEDVKDQLGITGENLDQLNQELEEAVANAEQAEQARTEAAGAIGRAGAELEAVKAQADVAKTCLRGAFDALDKAFAEGGVEAAVTELEALSGGCRSATSP
jgi:cystathionine beta-lyase/cystathionine gamma-synthase